MLSTRERKTSLTSTANDDEGPWSSGDEHKLDRNTRFKNGTYCGMLSSRRFTRSSQTSCVTDGSRARTGKRARISLLDTKNIMTLTERLVFLCEKNRRCVLKWGENRPLTGIQKKAPRQNEAQDSWNDSKTALCVATGSRSMFHEGDIRRRS